jgi:hypothetical protein
VTKSSVFFAFCGAALIACAGISCTSLALLVPNPSHGDGKKEKQEPSATPGTPEKEQRENTAEGSNDIDFSLAFAVDLLPETRTAPAAQKGGETADIVTMSWGLSRRGQPLLNNRSNPKGALRLR